MRTKRYLKKIYLLEKLKQLCQTCFKKIIKISTPNLKKNLRHFFFKIRVIDKEYYSVTLLGVFF